MMKYRIVIVDDHILIAKAIASILANFSQFEVLYECENGKVLQDRFSIESNIPDLVLLDISMPVMDGFETAKWLKKKHPGVKIMALSMQDDEENLFKMIKCGATGYLLKNVHPTELELALNAMRDKGTYYPDWATNKVFASLRSEAQVVEEQERHPINDREKEFLSWITSDLSYKEIAVEMSCSVRTIESYRDNLIKKLGLKSRMGLVIYAVKNGYAE